MYHSTITNKRYLCCGLIVILILSFSNIQYINSSIYSTSENLENTIKINQSNTIIENQSFTGEDTLQIIGADNVTIRGNSFLDNHDFSITVSNSQNIIIIENEFSTKKAIKLSSSENIHIMNNKVNENSEGINIIDSHGIQIYNNSFESKFNEDQKHPNFGIRMVQASLRLPKPITAINISLNSFNGYVNTISGTIVIDIIIFNNLFENNHRSISFSKSREIKILNNRMEQGSNLNVILPGTDDVIARGDFIGIFRSNNIEILNNKLSNSLNGAGLFIDDSNYTLISNNQIDKISDPSILLLDTDQTIISNNDISIIASNLETPGVEILSFRKDQLANYTISKNTISDIMNGNALTIQNMVNASIDNNQFLNIRGSSIELLGIANSVTISNNIFRDISKYGIEFSTSVVENLTVNSNKFDRIRLSPIHNAGEDVQISENSFVRVNMFRNQLIVGITVIFLVGVSVLAIRKRRYLRELQKSKNSREGYN